MKEALELFHDLYNAHCFGNTHFIVVFTKLDLFTKKLARSPIQNYFPDYTGGPDVRQAAQFFVKKFRDIAEARSPSGWETIIPVLADLTTGAGTGPFWKVFDSAMKRRDDLHLAADLFAITVLSCDGYLQPRCNPGLVRLLRFFNIASRLPMELQMMVCNRAAGSTRNNISSHHVEPSIVKVLKFLS